MIPLLLGIVMSGISFMPVDPEKEIYVESVENKVVIGKLAGDRNLEFGVKNILEEALMDLDYDLYPEAPLKLKVEIVYLDVLRTSRNISIFSKNSEAVVIRLKGTLYNNGEKLKESNAEESSSEISMATLVIDQGGTFNQTSLSNAIKKACEKLILEITGE